MIHFRQTCECYADGIGSGGMKCKSGSIIGSFPLVSSARHCVVVLESLLESHNMPPWEAMKVKLGLHTDQRTVMIPEP